MKTVRALKAFKYGGYPINKGDKLTIHELEVRSLVRQGKIEVLITPENRETK